MYPIIFSTDLNWSQKWPVGPLNRRKSADRRKNPMSAIWGILEANLKKSSTLMLMMNISFVPSICIHRSIIFNFIEKISTHFLTIVKNLTFSLFLTVCVCVFVERERERERNCILSQACYPKIHLSVLQTVCVRIFRFIIGLFSLFCLVLFCFFFFFFGVFFAADTRTPLFCLRLLKSRLTIC